MTIQAGPVNSQRPDPKIDIRAPDIFPNIALMLLGIVPQHGGLPIFSSQLTSNLPQQKYEVRSDVVQAPAVLLPAGSGPLPKLFGKQTDNLPQQKYEVRSDVYPNVVLGIPKHGAIPLPLSAGKLTDSSPSVYAKYNVAFFAPGRQLIYTAPTFPKVRQQTESAPERKYHVSFFAPSRQLVGVQANQALPQVRNWPAPKTPEPLQVFSYQKLLVPYVTPMGIPGFDRQQTESAPERKYNVSFFAPARVIAAQPVPLPLGLPFDFNYNNYKPYTQTVVVDLYPNQVVLGIPLPVVVIPPPPPPQSPDAGRKTRKHIRYVVRIDSQEFVCQTLAEALALLKKAREAAALFGAEAIERATKADFPQLPKLEPPRIVVNTRELRSEVSRTRRAIRETYAEALRDAEIRMYFEIDRRRTEEEETILLLM